jgi:hypothetical protein
MSVQLQKDEEVQIIDGGVWHGHHANMIDLPDEGSTVYTVQMDEPPHQMLNFHRTSLRRVNPPDYCFTCKKEVIAVEKACPHCNKTLWTACATPGGEHKKKLRTTRASYAMPALPPNHATQEEAIDAAIRKVQASKPG